MARQKSEFLKSIGVVFELYLAPAQRDGGSVSGFDLEQHLKDEKLIDRTLSLEAKMVKGWISNPPTYPEELKEKAVFLWKSQRGVGSNRNVAYFIWNGGRLLVDWNWLAHRWDGYYHVLLASS